MGTCGGTRRRGRSSTWTGAVSAAVVACAVLGTGAPVLAAQTSTGTADTVSAKGRKGGATESRWGDDTTREATKASLGSGRWKAAADHGSLFRLAADSGAHAAWKKGITGRGVTVAVIDTGIAPVEGLDDPGKVVNGPDLSYDSQRPGTRYVDGYGHGTHLAGIIAGRDHAFDPTKPDDDQFEGIAPDARLLNLKVGSADGGADVTQVIAALDWVVQHRHDNGLNVRVVNLAYGTASLQRWQVDPLARAVENAWNHGLVVVSAAGNDGLAATRLLMPAIDPNFLAVGAVDHRGTTGRGDDVVAAFTNGGSSARRSDVIAPGKSVVSLRVPGSYIDDLHPEGLVPGDRSDRFFRGSGTSQATAVVSGQVALLLQARPSLTPPQVRALLRRTARPLARRNPAMGTGVTNLGGALTARVPTTHPPRVRATGTGTLEASRGGEHVVDPTTLDVLRGERDALGTPWRARRWSRASATGQAWTGGSWNTRAWTGSTWTDGGWDAVAWTGNAWNGVPWADHAWSDAEWTARSWRDASWLARSWREASWSARSWRSLP
jgi:serine protease AprX